MSGTTSPTAPILAASNVVAAPTSTFLGLGMLASTLGQAVATQGLPTTTQGWVTFGLSMFGALFGIFGR